jgi:hypothetical protein
MPDWRDASNDAWNGCPLSDTDPLRPQADEMIEDETTQYDHFDMGSGIARSADGSALVIIHISDVPIPITRLSMVTYKDG